MRTRQDLCWYVIGGRIFFDGRPLTDELPAGIADHLALNQNAAIFLAVNSLAIDGRPQTEIPLPDASKQFVKFYSHPLLRGSSAPEDQQPPTVINAVIGDWASWHVEGDKDNNAEAVYYDGSRSITHTAPECQMTSYNPQDIENKYCGNCHRFLAEGEYQINHHPRGKANG